MAEELTPQQRFALEDPSEVVPRALSNGVSRDRIVRDLVGLYEWDADAATEYVERFESALTRFHDSPESRRELVREYKRHTLAGALIFLIATATSLFSVIAGLLAGGVVIIFWGFALVGLLLFCRGVSRWRRYRRSPN